MDNNRLKIALGFMVGAAAGAAIGLLTAPAKGSVTRKKIKGKVNDVTDDLMESATKQLDRAKDQYNSSVENALKSTKKGIDALQSKVKVD